MNFPGFGDKYMLDNLNSLTFYMVTEQRRVDLITINEF